MTVKEIARPVFIKKFCESGEAHVGQVVAVAYIAGGSVPYQYIKAAMFAELVAYLPDTVVHLILVELPGARAVFDGAAQAQYTYSFINEDIIFDGDTAIGRYLFILIIMITMYVIDRSVGNCS